MRRPLALSAVAVVALLGAPASAETFERCEPARVAGVCAGYTCDDPCVPLPYVYAYCEHPLPYAWCANVDTRL